MEIKNQLNKVLNNYDINLNNDILDKINNFNNFMLEYNQIHNLTAITEEKDVIFKHYLDSLLGLKVFEKYLNNNKIENKTKKIIDIGAGAGFPCIPLCIANENLNIVALDSVHKKTDFIKQSKSKFNIENLNVINGRVENIANKQEYREKFDFVISRAVASLPTLIEYSAPFLKNNGKIIAYKGSNYENELKEAKNAMQILDCSLENIYEFKIPELESMRYILILNKNSKISSKYPRMQNKPRLAPL